MDSSNCESRIHPPKSLNASASTRIPVVGKLVMIIPSLVSLNLQRVFVLEGLEPECRVGASEVDCGENTG